jgi:hypothetical protein
VENEWQKEKAELVTVARRFVGTTLVILGLVLALAYLSAPLALATALLQYATGAALLTILGTIVWMNVKCREADGMTSNKTFKALADIVPHRRALGRRMLTIAGLSKAYKGMGGRSGPPHFTTLSFCCSL